MNAAEEIPTHILVADYRDPDHRQAIVDLLDGYARDPMGGGPGLSKWVKENLVDALARQRGAFTILAFARGEAAGLINCFQGFSTFRCKPLINIHDVTVVPQFRGRGIARRMLEKVETIARQRGCCKLTLEVLEGNRIAQSVYRQAGFSSYELDPAMGRALFWEKKLASGH